jgi:hypothetical protein
MVLTITASSRTERTKLMRRSSLSTHLPDAPAWLGNVYAARRQLTTDLVRMSIDALEKEGTPVSIAAVVAVSRHIDPSRKGISESASAQSRCAGTIRGAPRVEWQTPTSVNLAEP